MPRPENPNLDLSQLYSLIAQDSQENTQERLKFAEHSKRFARAAFDLFRDNNSEFLWRLEKDADSGEEFIVRTAMVDPTFRTAANWSAECDSAKTAITLLYKGHAVRAFKKAELQFNEDSVDQWRKYLLDRISTDPSFLKQVVQNVSNSRKKLLQGSCPELFE